MKVAILLSVLALCSGVFGAAPFATDRTNQKTVDALCTLRNDNVLEMYAAIDFNGNDVDAILALPGPRFERDSNGNTNNVPCTFTGNLQTDNGATIEADVLADGGRTGSNTCGATPIRDTTNSNTLVGYEWYIQVRERFSDLVYTDIDRTYHIQCYFDAVINNYVTTSVQVYIADDLTGNATPVKPISTLRVVSDDTSVALNEQVRLRVQTQQSAVRGPLHPYGCFVYQCDVRYTPPGVRTLWLSSTGCPVTGNQFGLGEGFQFFRYDTIFSNLQSIRVFETQTPRFVLAPTRPPNDFYYISCYVGYCVGTEGSDSRCNDFCSYNQVLNGKKKRSTHENNADADRVTLAIRIRDTENEPSDSGNATGSDDPESTTLIAILATVGAVFFLLVVIATCCVCFAFRRRADDDDKSSTDGSTNNLPRHLKDEHFRPAKF